MGGTSSSPRQITIESDDGVVRVSESVAKRLLGHTSDSVQDSNDKNVGGLSEEFVTEEIERLKDQYENRIKQLETKNEELFHTTTEQFAKTVEEVEQKFLKTTASPICQDLEALVLKCYQDNPGRTLNCAKEVQAFAACVNAQREKILQKRS